MSKLIDFDRLTKDVQQVIGDQLGQEYGNSISPTVQFTTRVQKELVNCLNDLSKEKVYYFNSYITNPLPHVNGIVTVPDDMERIHLILDSNKVYSFREANLEKFVLSKDADTCIIDEDGNYVLVRVFFDRTDFKKKIDLRNYYNPPAGFKGELKPDTTFTLVGTYHYDTIDAKVPNDVEYYLFNAACVRCLMYVKNADTELVTFYNEMANQQKALLDNLAVNNFYNRLVQHSPRSDFGAGRQPKRNAGI